MTIPPPPSIVTQLREEFVCPSVRLRGLRALHEFGGVEWPVAVSIETEVLLLLAGGGAAADSSEYLSAIRRLAFALACNKTNLLQKHGSGVARCSDHELTEGTTVERLRVAEAERIAAYREMLESRYDAIKKMAKDEAFGKELVVDSGSRPLSAAPSPGGERHR